MLDKMTNDELLTYVEELPNVTPTERELAERLLFASDEIEKLVAEINLLRAAEVRHQAEVAGG